MILLKLQRPIKFGQPPEEQGVHLGVPGTRTNGVGSGIGFRRLLGGSWDMAHFPLTLASAWKLPELSSMQWSLLEMRRRENASV